MSTSKPTSLPIALRTPRRQFDQWRRRHRRRARLPEKLWRQATALAHRHGLNKTADALGLNYYSLKKRIEAPVDGIPKAGEAPCEFLELLPSATAAASLECRIELDDGSGATVRIQVKGARMVDLVSFASAWRGTRA